MPQMKPCNGPGCDVRKPRHEMLGPFRNLCSTDCGIALARLKQAEKREKDRQHMERVSLKLKSEKTRNLALENAQKAINAFVRVRDYGKPCISCGRHKPHTAGHHKSVGNSPHLRYDTRNINGQCSFCNEGHVRKFHDPTIADKYDQGVVKRYGQKRLDWINGPHPAKQYSLDDLNKIRRIFKRRMKIYKKFKGLD